MRIGNLDTRGNVFLAPMAGITDPPFRKTVQRFGASALWTEMISADGLIKGRTTFPTMDLSGQRIPTVFQIYGTDPVIMADAARIAESYGAAAVDVNMGCPSRKIVHKGAGAALMKDLPLAGRIVAAIRKSVNVPLTVKIRSGWDENNLNAPVLAKILEAEGVDAITLHSRSRSRLHSGTVSFDMIREVVQAVGIPVIGNGGITCVQDALTMLADTGCDGVMIGRGALGRPWLPARILERLGRVQMPQSQSTTLFDVIRDHFHYHLEWWNMETTVRRMRKHLGWYSKGFADGCEFRKMVFREDDPERVISSVEDFFGKAVIS
jgi:tRNA-dihydrouridine synthase B